MASGGGGFRLTGVEGLSREMVGGDTEGHVGSPRCQVEVCDGFI